MRVSVLYSNVKTMCIIEDVLFTPFNFEFSHVSLIPDLPLPQFTLLAANSVNQGSSGVCRSLRLSTAGFDYILCI